MIEIQLNLGRPHHPWAEVRIPNGVWKLQRSKDPGFKILEHEVIGKGPTLIDEGPHRLGIPLNGRPHYYRLVSPNGETSPVFAVNFPHWKEYTPYESETRSVGMPVQTGPAPKGVPLPRFVYREGRKYLWRKYGTRLCHRELLQSLDLGQLAVDIYNHLLLPADKRRLDALSMHNFPGMGYAGQILAWLLNSAYRLSLHPARFIVGSRSPLYGKRLSDGDLVKLVREGELSTPQGTVRLYHWAPRMPIRVHVGMIANMHPDSDHLHGLSHWQERSGIGDAGTAMQLVHDNPMAVTYRPGDDRVRPEVIGWTRETTLDYRTSDQILAALIGAGPECGMLGEATYEMIRRVAQR